MDNTTKMYTVQNIRGWYLTFHTELNDYVYTPVIYPASLHSQPPRELAQVYNGTIVEYNLVLSQVFTKV